MQEYEAENKTHGVTSALADKITYSENHFQSSCRSLLINNLHKQKIPRAVILNTNPCSLSEGEMAE